MDLTNINYLAVTVSAFASFAFGVLWYNPILFGKIWQKEIGLTDDDLKKSNMAIILGTTFILTIVMAFGMALLIQARSTVSFNWITGMFHGLASGIFFVGTSMAINYLYQRKSFTLWAIDAGYQILFLCMMGAILGAWN